MKIPSHRSYRSWSSRHCSSDDTAITSISISVSFDSTTYRVFIATPSDMPEERQIATEVINEWNVLHAATEGVVLLPIRWETHVMPETGVRPQDAINRQLVADCELLLGMFWTKLGTSTDVADSGTVEEIDQFVRTNRPAMLYFSRRPIDPTKIDDLFYILRTLMPYGQPATLSKQEYIDIIAYLLMMNGHPAGAQALPLDPSVLGHNNKA